MGLGRAGGWSHLWDYEGGHAAAHTRDGVSFATGGMLRVLCLIYTELLAKKKSQGKLFACWTESASLPSISLAFLPKAATTNW